MKNKIALHICYWFGTEIDRDLERMVDYTALAHPDVIELNLGSILSLNPATRRDLRQRIEAGGMTATVNGGMMTPQNDISSPTASVRQVGYDHCRRALEACKDLGSPYWSGIMHSAWLLKPDPLDPIGDKQRTWLRSIESMRALMPIASEYGIDCCIEIVNRYEQFLINTAAEGVAFCEAVGSPFCKLLLDVFHMSIEEDNVADSFRLAQASGMIGSLHVGETNRRMPRGGRSNIRWQELKSAILDGGYAGPVVLEPLPFATAGGASKTCIWRNLEDPSNLVALVQSGKEGVAFMRDLIGIQESKSGGQKS